MAPGILGYFGLRSDSVTGQEAAPTKDAVRALPANWYTSKEMYELERRSIFSRKWLMMTHQVRVKEPGSFVRYTVAGYDFVLTRDRNGSINAFHNVCRHRAYPVVESTEGNAKILSCRYHGWSYGLNGKLAKAPGYQELDGFDKNQNSLFPIHVRVDVNGFVWINMDSKDTPEVPWEQDFEGVDEQDRFKQYNFDEYVFDHTWAIDAKYNWKIAADNYNECYHCKTTHPDIPSIANLETYDVFPKAGHIDHDASTTEKQRAEGLCISSTYYFPNASMTVTPHFFFMQKFLPTNPTETHVLYEVYRNKNSPEDEFQRINQMYKRIMTEDKGLCDLAQKNLSAGVFINGELHPKMEKGPLYFQKQCREVVTEHHKREKKEGKEYWPAKSALPKTRNSLVSQEDEDFCTGLACGPGKEELAW